MPTNSVVGFDWSLFLEYAWPPTALQHGSVAVGLITTVYVAVLAQALASVIGLVGALAKSSRFRLVRVAVGAYTTYFRGTPLLVQIVIVYFSLSEFGLYRFPDLVLGAVVVPGVAQAGILALALNKGANMVEIVRAGLLAVDHGQAEAGRALGMTHGRVLRSVILPQAARAIVPPLGNEFNSTMKDTAVLVIIGGVELFHAFTQINGRLFKPFELYLAMSLYYLWLTLLWSAAQSLIERRVNRGTATATAARRPPRRPVAARSGA